MIGDARNCIRHKRWKQFHAKWVYKYACIQISLTHPYKNHLLDGNQRNCSRWNCNPLNSHRKGTLMWETVWMLDLHSSATKHINNTYINNTYIHKYQPTFVSLERTFRIRLSIFSTPPRHTKEKSPYNKHNPVKVESFVAVYKNGK